MIKRGIAIGLLLGAAGMLASDPATAASLTLSSGFTVKPTLTYTTVAAVTAGLTGGTYTGVGSLFVSTVSTATTGFGSLCTGSLLSSNVVITAAHCLSDTNEQGVRDPVTSVTFFLPSYGQATAASSFAVSSWTVSPTYTGDATEGGDFALFTLSQKTSGYQTYSIYNGDPLKDFTRVGTGTIGGPKGTDTEGVTDDYKQRAGRNEYEYYGDLITGWSENILLSDFDDGTANHDVFGRLLGAAAAQTGIAGESNSSPGDSGGPEFINGKIVSVTSFGISGDAFRTGGYCGGFRGQNSIDPYGDGGTTGVRANNNGCTNSSVGELSGDTWLRPYETFIDSYVHSAVPEPSSWAMMLGGLGLMGGALRQRRRTGAVA
jgi:secreted trypsin-like serine protease